MKILNLSFADAAGSAYALSHALNKYPDIRSVNLRSSDNYIAYPTIAEMRFYQEPECRKMVYDSDVIVFHTGVWPFITGLHLDKDRLKDKKKILYFHGSDARGFGKDILKQADEYFGTYDVVVSTPDLLRIVPQAAWLPVARSFKELRTKYGPNRQDARALNAFGGAVEKIVFGHAPTSQERKGSELFFKTITEAMKTFKNAEFSMIQNMSWDVALRSLSRVNIFFDQHIIGAYGLASVEAAMFKAAVFVRLDQDVMDVMKRESGIDNPFIQWPDADGLLKQTLTLCEKPSLLHHFGNLAYDYAKRVHDEKPVAERFLKIIGAK